MIAIFYVLVSDVAIVEAMTIRHVFYVLIDELVSMCVVITVFSRWASFKKKT